MKILAKRGQISMEFAILLAAVVAAVSLLGFYYLKSITTTAKTTQETQTNTSLIVQNKYLEISEKAKEVT